MPNGTLKLYNKLDNTLLVSLDILGTFNIEENLNETPSNMKVKVITSNTYREEFQVNTIAYHEDTNTWWVIKSDESTYLHTGEYEHEIQLTEFLEFYTYRHLPNCAFAPNTYTLEQMLERLFYIAKITTIAISFPTFLNKDKVMPFVSFENYTLANAIKNIARSINAIPKMLVNTSGGFTPTLTFINRNGLDNAIVNTLDTQFPIAYEKNTNSNDQFTTRSVSNINNAKSSNLVIVPKNGGFKNTVPNSITFSDSNRDEARLFLPSKIDKIEFVNVLLPVYLVFRNAGGSRSLIYKGYYLSKQKFIEELEATDLFDGGSLHPFESEDLQEVIDSLPEPKDFYKVYYGQEVNKNFVVDTIEESVGVYHKKMSLLNKFDYDTLSKLVDGVKEVDVDTQERTIHWKPFTNEVIMPKSLRNGLVGNTDHNINYIVFEKAADPSGVNQILISTLEPGYNSVDIKNEEVLIQVGYYPIADIKVSIDNDNDAQDEKFFNQSGKVIDAMSVSKLITAHTNDSVEGTKIRNARYESIASVLPVGQIVRDNNQLYVITQRSIDGQVKNGNEYYNVLYTLSRNRVARSENIVADSAVISYKTPDDNLVFRNQLYKDYIELSLVNNNQDEPYLNMGKALVLSDTLAGTNFDFTTIAEWRYKPTTITTTIVRHVSNGSIFDLHKAKLFNINYQDNNVLGFRLDRVSDSVIAQTPIVYTNSVGRAISYEFFLLDTEDMDNAITYYNDNYTPDPIIPFTDLTQVNDNFYFNSMDNQDNYSLKIEIPNYDKDPFEIPVFEYMIQGNDDYSDNGNIAIGNDLFSTFTGTLRYHYVINNGTRFTAENANKLYTDNTPSSETNRIVKFVREVGTPHIIDLDVYSTYVSAGSNTRNTSAITNVGIYATDGTTVKFLFAINDYVENATITPANDKSNIRVYINNWKI
jgi:hypothetical protein